MKSRYLVLLFVSLILNGIHSESLQINEYEIHTPKNAYGIYLQQSFIDNFVYNHSLSKICPPSSSQHSNEIDNQQNLIACENTIYGISNFHDRFSISQSAFTSYKFTKNGLVYKNDIVYKRISKSTSTDFSSLQNIVSEYLLNLLFENTNYKQYFLIKDGHIVIKNKTYDYQLDYVVFGERYDILHSEENELIGFEYSNNRYTFYKLSLNNEEIITSELLFEVKQK